MAKVLDMKAVFVELLSLISRGGKKVTIQQLDDIFVVKLMRPNGESCTMHSSQLSSAFRHAKHFAEPTNPGFVRPRLVS